MDRNRIGIIPRVVAGLALFLGGPGYASASDAPETTPVPEALEVCLACHAYQPDEPALDGPSLWQVVGRRIAGLDSYAYSAGLRKVQGTWDRPTLDRFLAAPKAFAPGIEMTFGGMRDAAERAAVLDFLETLVPTSRAEEANR